MKNKLILKLIAFYFLCFQSVSAQWQVIEGPFGVETSSAVFLDSLCFSGTLNGLAVSNDNGTNWSYLNTGISGGYRSMLEFNDGKLIYDRFYNTSGGIISLDSGLTWNTMTVSYTHLRAHETVLDLVCRLLLEKKKSTNYDLSLIHISHIHRSSYNLHERIKYDVYRLLLAQR